MTSPPSLVYASHAMFKASCTAQVGPGLVHDTDCTYFFLYVTVNKPRSTTVMSEFGGLYFANLGSALTAASKDSEAYAEVPSYYNVLPG